MASEEDNAVAGAPAEPDPRERAVRVDVLKTLYLDASAQFRHVEDQASRHSNILIVIVAALLGADWIGGRSGTATSFIPPLMVCLIGLYGLVYSIKFRQRKYLFVYRQREFRTLLSKALPELGIDEAAEAARQHNRRRFFITSRMTTGSAWALLYLGIILIGALKAAFELNAMDVRGVIARLTAWL